MVHRPIRPVATDWLQKPEDCLESLKSVDHLHKKRIESAYYHEALRPGGRVGIVSYVPSTLKSADFAAFLGIALGPLGG